jgi:prepilin-type processing-associated H-X9-DG protein
MIRPARHRASSGITLLEVMVIIAVIGVLLALLLPALESSRCSGRRTQCVNNLKQIALALVIYEGRHGFFPAGYEDGGTFRPGAPPRVAGWAWGVRILDELEQRPLYDSANFSAGLGGVENATLRRTSVMTYLCPSSVGEGPIELDGARGPVALDLAAGQYVGNAGQLDPAQVAEGNGILYRNSRVMTADIIDGTANTLMVGERTRSVADATWAGVPVGGLACNPVERGKPGRTCEPPQVLVLGSTGRFNGGPAIRTPNRARAGPGEFSSGHPGGANVVMADGSVRFLSAKISPVVFSTHGSRAGGENVCCAGSY